MDARRYGHWRCDWQEGQSHWVRRRDGGLAGRKRGWSIAEVVVAGNIFAQSVRLVVTDRTFGR